MFIRRVSALSFSSFVLAAMFVGCGKDEKPPESKPAGPTTTHTCSLEVRKVVPPESFEGDASGPDEAKVKADAWAAVCAKVPEADRADCSEDSKTFEWSAGGGSVTSGGKVSYSTTLKLTRRPPDGQRGRASSATSIDDACAAAMAEACGKLGAGSGDCTKDGAHEQVNIAKSIETTSSGR